MAQGLLQLPTTGTVSGLQNNQDANAALAALAAMVQGGSAPTPASTGLASTAGVVWHDTTNNQVKLRDQGDSTWMPCATVDEANKLAYPVNAIPVAGLFKNLQLAGSGTGVTITADELVLEDANGNPLRLRNVNTSITWATSGAGGLDTGAFAANNWYYHWVIYKPSTQTVSAITSLSSSAPTMPSGYTHKCRVGATRSISTTKAWHVQQYNRRAQIIVDGTDVTGLPIIASGAAGSVSTPTWVTVATGPFVPATASSIRGVAVGNNFQISIAPNGNYGSVTSSTNPPPVTGNNTSNQNVPFELLLESANIYWASAVAGYVEMAVLGWEDNL